MLGRATGNTDTQDSPRPGLGGSHHLPPYSILCDSPRDPHPNGFSLPGLWIPITLRADLGSKCGLKQSCSSHRDLSNDMSHVICIQVFRVDSRLSVVGSQNWQTPGSSTPGPSFGHNLRFRRSNEQCEPILDIYASRAFHLYKERHNPLRFDPSNWSLKCRESTGTPSPKAGVALGVWGFTLSHFPTLPGVPDVTPGLPFGMHPCNPFALVVSPKHGGGFPKSGSWWVLCVRVARGSSQHQRCSNYALTTLCGLCAGPCEWISLSILPSPIPELQHAPSKCCELGNASQLLLLPLSFTWTHIWVLQGVGSAS